MKQVKTRVFPIQSRENACVYQVIGLIDGMTFITVFSFQFRRFECVSEWEREREFAAEWDSEKTGFTHKLSVKVPLPLITQFSLWKLLIFKRTEIRTKKKATAAMLFIDYNYKYWRNNSM